MLYCGIFPHKSRNFPVTSSCKRYLGEGEKIFFWFNVGGKPSSSFYIFLTMVAFAVTPQAATGSQKFFLT